MSRFHAAALGNSERGDGAAALAGRERETRRFAIQELQARAEIAERRAPRLVLCLQAGAVILDGDLQRAFLFARANRNDAAFGQWSDAVLHRVFDQRLQRQDRQIDIERRSVDVER